jgi:hypothetical protein
MRKHISFNFVSVVLAIALNAIFCQVVTFALGGGALAGERYRVIISSDIGGSDEDDIQSLIHYLLYSDLFDTEGIISSPPGKGRKIDILKVIDEYEKDYPNLKTWSDKPATQMAGKYPTPDYLRSISKQGAIDPAPAAGYGNPTEGSQWIIQCAKKKDERPLYVLVWGAITDVVQALHNEPGIKEKIRVHYIASWNYRQDPNSFEYIDKIHPDLWIIYNNSTFRGWYVGGEQSGNTGNKRFVDKYIIGRGALGEYFATLKGGSIKMGDTPSYAYLLRGVPDDPTKESWGGQFVKKEGRPNWWVDDPDPTLKEGDYFGAKTVNKWRQEYLGDWQKRMERCISKAPLNQLAGSTSDSENNFVPFVIPAKVNPNSPIAAVVSKPIATDSERLAANGHFYRSGERIRLWGVNLSFGANLPSHEDAPHIAARLAEAGVNTVRCHHTDTAQFPRGLWDEKNPKILSAEALDRLDYFIDQLARYGILININLHVGRVHSQYLDLPKTNREYDKIYNIFTPVLIDAQRQYARELLTHVNKYRKVRYTDDPAVAIVEITNENSFFMWDAEETLRTLPPYYADILRRKFNAWLKAKYGSDEKLRLAWGEGAQPLGQNILANGSFQATSQGESVPQKWSLEQHSGCIASVSRYRYQNQEGVRIDINKANDIGWHLQLNQSELAIKAGRFYSVIFQAASSEPRQINCSVTQGHSPWNNLGFSQQEELAGNWQMFRFGFVAKAEDDNARLNFSFGGSNVPVYLANVEFRPGGRTGLQEVESIGAGNIAVFSDNETPMRRIDRMCFLAETEKTYFDGMRNFIKQELGCKALVTGTIVFGPLGLYAQSDMDFIDAHAYWQHPRFPGRPWDAGNWIVEQKAMTDWPAEATLFRLAAERLSNKPFTVSEYNHPAPNDYQAECVPMIGSFAAAQDWDGVWLYTYSHSENQWYRETLNSYFDIDTNPAKWGFMRAGAAIFRDGSIRPLNDLNAFGLAQSSDMLISLAKLHLQYDRDMFSCISEFPQVHIHQDFLSGPPTKINWFAEDSKGFYNVSGRCAQVYTGHTERFKKATDGQVSITKPGFVAMAITSLDGKSIVPDPCLELSEKILVTACGRCENFGMKFSEDRGTVGRNWGEPPVQIEAVEANLVLPKGQWICQALGPDGMPTVEVPISQQNGKSVLQISPQYKTMWYLLTRPASLE